MTRNKGGTGRRGEKAENRTNHVGLVSRLGWRYSRQDSCCQATWRQTSDRQSTAVSPVRPFANRHLTVPFCPLEPFHHNLLWYCHVNNSIYFAGNPIIFIVSLGLSSRAHACSWSRVLPPPPFLLLLLLPLLLPFPSNLIELVDGFFSKFRETF